MRLLCFRCPSCDEEWEIPKQSVNNPREHCVQCDASLEIEERSVTP